jgi:hypothetical protein
MHAASVLKVSMEFHSGFPSPRSSDQSTHSTISKTYRQRIRFALPLVALIPPSRENDSYASNLGLLCTHTPPCPPPIFSLFSARTLSSPPWSHAAPDLDQQRGYAPSRPTAPCEKSVPIPRGSLSKDARPCQDSLQFPVADHGLVLFMQAARWADDIRTRDKAQNRPPWHYINLPFKPEGHRTACRSVSRTR